MIVENNIMISAPPAEAWRLTQDPTTMPDWTPTVSWVQALDGAPVAVGNRYRVKQPLQAARVWTVTDVVPGQSFEWISTEARPRFRARHVVAETAGGALSSLWIEGWDLPVHLPRWLLSRAIAGALRRENRGLKARAEAA